MKHFSTLRSVMGSYSGPEPQRTGSPTPQTPATHIGDAPTIHQTIQSVPLPYSDKVKDINANTTLGEYL